MKFCTKCGNQLKPDSRFCGKCGEIISLVEKPAELKPVAVPVCKSCGAVISKGIKFCTACGARAHSPAQNVQQPQVLQPSSPAVGRTKKQRIAVPKRKLGKKSWIIACSMLIVLAGIATTVWFLKYRQNAAEDIIRPEYAAHPLVSGTTVTETKKINILAGGNTLVLLSDSSSVFIPGLKSNAGIELKKENNDIVLNIPGLKTSGYMLSVTIEGSDSISTSQPVITIPRSQVGDINPATINIVRVSDVVCADGSVIKSQPRYLPVTIDRSGNYKARDYMFPYTAPALKTTAQTGDIITRIARALIPAACAEGNTPGKMTWVGSVKYSIVTFQDDLNWGKNPRLVQMTPDRKTDHFRHPATQPERFKRTAPVINVVVLVHGHNEEESDGYVPSKTADLWEFKYKRDVWNYMYKYYLDQALKVAAADPNKKDSCTLFYEFIYPSYRPAYSPVLTNTNQVCRTLGQDLGEDLNYELIKKNPQVAEMIKNNIPFNLFIVAHSMGGLVARAALRYLDSRIISNFKQLVTWGTPHQGSPVTTLRYIAAAGFNIKIDNHVGYPYGPFPGGAMQYLAMDTPGTRDLRWTDGSNTAEKFFDYEKFFSAKNEEQDNDPELSLQSGSKFYNDHLKKFNETEQFTSKYTFLTGSTTRIATVAKGWFLSSKAVRLYFATGCAQGSYLINLMAANDKFIPNDGTSPVYGQGGMDLSPRPKTIDMGNVDHEQFYTDSGETTAEKTFEVMKESATCDCPYITDYEIHKDTISAKLIWTGDENPGKSIAGIEAVVTDIKTNKVVLTSTDFNYKDPKGIFSGIISRPKNDSLNTLHLLLKITTKDGSIIEYSSDYLSSSDINWNIYTKITISLMLDGRVRSMFQDLREPKKIVDETNEDGLIIMDFANGGTAETSISIPIKWEGNKFHVQATYDDKGYHYETTMNGEITAVPLTEKPEKRSPQYQSGVVGKYDPHILTGTATQVCTRGEYKTIGGFHFTNMPFAVIFENEATFQNIIQENIVGLYVTDIKKEEYGPNSIEKFSCSSGNGLVTICLKIK